MKRGENVFFMLSLMVFMVAGFLSCSSPTETRMGSISVSIPEIASWLQGKGQEYEKQGSTSSKSIESRAFAVADRVVFYLYDSSDNLIDTQEIENGYNYIEDWSVPAGSGYSINAKIFNNAVSTSSPVVEGWSDLFGVNAGQNTQVFIMCFPNSCTQLEVGSSSNWFSSPEFLYEKWFSFTANSSYTKVDVSSSNSSEESFVFAVFDSQGYYLNSNVNDFGGATVNTTSAALYYIAVLDISDSSDSFSVSISNTSAPVDDSFEDNDYMDEAKYLNENTDYDLISNDDDWFRIEVLSGYERVNIQISFDSSAGDLDLYLRDNNGNYLVSSTGTSGTESIDYVVPSEGRYFIIVYNYSGDNRQQPYTLWWDDEPPSGRGTISVYIE